MIKYLLGFFLCIVATTANAQTPVACGTADDTAAIQAAISNHSKVVLPIGTCRVSSLDVTDLSGVTIEGQGILATQIVPIADSVNVIDVTGSSNVLLRDFRICGYCDLARVPTTGILSGQSTAGYHSDVFGIERVRVDGNFGLSALYVHGTASSYIRSGQFYNYQPNALVAIFTGNNFFGAVSAFTTTDNGNHYAPSDWTIAQTEFHNFGNGWGLWMGGTDSFRFYGGNVSSSHKLVGLNQVALSSGLRNPSNIIFDGTTFYGDELTHVSPPCVLSGITGAAALRSNNTNGIPVTAGGC